MSAVPNLALVRLAVFLGMVAATVTLLYLAPVPNQSVKSCDRPCHELDWPMICRFKLTIEKLPTSVICQECQNSVDCPYCTSQVDLPQELTLINRQLPAPTFHVCHNDILIVDVINKLQTESLTMHWRGQNNEETPFMDGVPLITQCPVGPYTTYQYKFRASSPGTHSYHAFSDFERTNGLHGALVIRKAEKIEPNIYNYDIDNKNHVLVIAETNNSVLINGVGPSSPQLSKLTVKRRTRNLFRLIYASGLGCPLTITINNHVVKVLSVDGTPIIPLEVTSIKVNKGETLEFVLEANQKPGSYLITAKSTCRSKELIGKAIVTYKGSSVENNLKNISYAADLRNFDTGFCDQKTGKLCVRDIKPNEGMEGSLRHLVVEKKIFLAFDKRNVHGLTRRTHLINQYKTNNVSFTFPPSPILTQPTDVPLDLMCNEKNLPERCKNKEHCDCVHLKHIPLGSTTELVLIHQGGDDEEYIFHLHGYQFYVVGARMSKTPFKKSDVEKLDADYDFIKRNLKNPVKKNTVRVPKNSVVAVRFLANNPGFWLLRDENAQGWTRGLDVLFQVGDTGDIVAPPSSFPYCGNFIGPQFFIL
ncbi:unnamed protein product [Diabrotica balteata]|uniref:Uncharacterized protein n=1 Tax=Diabrotica balteata TaxID=107213 RepID=A0A9N9SYA4_DIABA|nr:unnamed protein product [Diabrotica balteata]